MYVHKERVVSTTIYTKICRNDFPKKRYTSMTCFIPFHIAIEVESFKDFVILFSNFIDSTTGKSITPYTEY